MSTELIKAGEATISTELAPVDRLANVQRLGKILAASGYFSDVRDMAQAAVKVMAGEELGIAPVAAVMGIHIIKGKVTLSGHLIAVQVRRHGYNFRHIRFDNTGCVLEFVGKDGKVLGESSFTEEDAKTAGVFSDMYKKFPRNMYFNRAMSNGSKWYCPEVMCGLPVYVPEELGARVDSEGELIHDEPQIDTGGHPKNSRAAQEHVRDKKLAEMREQRQESAGFHATDDDLPSNLGGPPEDPEAVRKAAERLENTRQNLQQPARPWSTKGEMRTLFADVKSALEAHGDDISYFAELDLFDIKDPNNFKNGEDALKCYLALQSKLRKARTTEEVAA